MKKSYSDTRNFGFSNINEFCDKWIKILDEQKTNHYCLECNLWIENDDYKHNCKSENILNYYEYETDDFEGIIKFLKFFRDYDKNHGLLGGKL